MHAHLDPKNLTPGVLDGYAREAFRRGACGALALAIHRETGWPIVAITDHHNVFEDGLSTEADVIEWYVESQGEPIPVNLARSFVAPVLKAAGLR